MGRDKVKRKAWRDEYQKKKRSVINAAQRKWRENNKEKIKKSQRVGRLKRVYGITEADYNRMFEQQQGCCLICYKHQSEISIPLHVDHCHKHGPIRGLLCTNCNTAIGLFKDNIEIMKSAINYLSNGTK